jgi:hypothetical protein
MTIKSCLRIGIIDNCNNDIDVAIATKSMREKTTTKNGGWQ